jgi:hypothetical protein
MKLTERKISIWCDELVAFSTLSALIERYESREYKIYLYTPSKNVSIASEYYKDINIIPIEDVDKKILRIFYNFYLLFFADYGFSAMFARSQLHKFGIFLYSIAKFIKLHRLVLDVDRVFFKLFKISDNVFESTRIISLSRVSRPYLFNNVKLRHVAFVESWDHPVKAPWFLKPRIAMVWNKDLKNDIKKYQNIQSIYQVSPAKFNYIYFKQKYKLNASNELLIKDHYKKDEELINNAGSFVTYAMAYSEKNKNAFKGELLFIEQLVEACSVLNMCLFIKPKPFGSGNAINKKFESYEKVIVGRSPLFAMGLDLISQNYNNYRKNILSKTELLVDCGSTFMLDAAIYKCSVVKLLLDFDGLSNAFDATRNNPHLKHLDSVSYKYNGDTLKLTELLKDYSKYDVSKELREWIYRW